MSHSDQFTFLSSEYIPFLQVEDASLSGDIYFLVSFQACRELSVLLNFHKLRVVLCFDVLPIMHISDILVD